MVEDLSDSVLGALLLELPEGIWWKVRQTDPDELGLAKGTGRPLAEIDAVLVGAGACNDTPKRGISWSKPGWDAFVTRAKLPDSIDTTGSIGKMNGYVCNGTPLNRTPSEQKKAKLRSIPVAGLPAHLVQSLKICAGAYDNRKAKQAKKEQSKAKQQAKEDAAKARAEEKEKAKSIMYPVLSKVFGTEEEISLDNPMVDEWSRSVLPELSKLYSSSGKDISFKSESGEDITWVEIPHSQDESSFIVNESKTKWIPTLLWSMFGDRLSISDGAQLLRRTLCTYYEEEQTQSNSDDSADDANVSISSSSYHVMYHFLSNLSMYIHTLITSCAAKAQQTKER